MYGYFLYERPVVNSFSPVKNTWLIGEKNMTDKYPGYSLQETAYKISAAPTGLWLITSMLSATIRLSLRDRWRSCYRRQLRKNGAMALHDAPQMSHGDNQFMSVLTPDQCETQLPTLGD